MRLGAVRQCIHDALTWGLQKRSEMGMVEWARYLCKIDRSIRKNDWHAVDLLEVGAILAAIDQQRGPVRSWLHYAYGPDNNESHRRQAADDIYLNNFVGFRTADRHRALCRCAIDDYRLRLAMGRQMPVEVYAKEMDINPANWARDWHRKKEECLDWVMLFDSEGVARVSMVVRHLRGDGEDGKTLADVLKECGEKVDL